jgi:nucleoid-associated protein YgaU
MLPPAATRPPAPPAAAPAPEPAVQEHVIAEGDTLSKISTKYYGTPTGWKRIFEANRNLLSDPGRLPTGASIKIP